MLGGAGYVFYTPLTLVYGGLLVLSFLGFYLLLFFAVDWSEVPKDYFSWLCFFGGVLLLNELLFSCVTRTVFLNGEIVRGFIYTGWGMYNDLGAMLAMFLPSTFYLARREKYGLPFYFAAVAFFGGVVLTGSRTSTVAAFLISLICIAVSAGLSKGKRRKALLCVFFLSLAGSILAMILLRGSLTGLLADLLYSVGDTRTRFKGYLEGLRLFLKNPLFGTGFYSCEEYKWGAGDSFIPARWHNTAVQLLASCEIFGFMAYCMHRARTFVLAFYKPTAEKTFVFLSMAVLLLCSCWDCHLFNIGPGIIYSVLLLFLEKSEECGRNFAAPLPQREKARRTDGDAA